MRIVIAVGGNALLRRGEALTAENQRRNMRAVAQALANGVDGHEVAIVHGNGPQVGLLALEAAAYTAVPAYPLDVLGAESQGMIGYVIAQELRNARPAREIAALITQTVIDPRDPAFQRPTKPIGPFYTKEAAVTFASQKGWTFAAEERGLRRVVASPLPVEIVETPMISRLVATGAIVICAGGGGVPVAKLTNGALDGLEAVIDKDHSAALLAEKLNADRLIILTDVDGVFLDWGKAEQRLLARARVAELRAHTFAEGSMGPKVDALCRFVERTGRSGVIGALRDAESAITLSAGTVVSS